MNRGNIPKGEHPAEHLDEIIKIIREIKKKQYKLH